MSFFYIFRFGSVNPKYLEEQWASHLVDILTYHVTTGSVTSDMLTLGMPVNMVNMESARITSMTPPMINQATISGPDNVASNGVVHVVDSVLLPESATTSILQAASKTPELSTLADLIVAGGLNSTLQGEGPFTVFAPTNEGTLSLYLCIILLGQIYLMFISSIFSQILYGFQLLPPWMPKLLPI